VEREEELTVVLEELERSIDIGAEEGDGTN
jgi:hypothetical protein